MYFLCRARIGLIQFTCFANRFFRSVGVALKTVNGDCRKTMTTCTKMCVFRIARIFALLIGSNVAVNTPDQTILLGPNTLYHRPVSMIKDEVKMPSAHDFHWFYAQGFVIVVALGRGNVTVIVTRVDDVIGFIIVVTLGRGNVLQLGGKYTRYGRTDNNDNTP